MSVTYLSFHLIFREIRIRLIPISMKAILLMSWRTYAGRVDICMYLQMWAEYTYTYTLTSGSYEFDFAVQRCGNWDVIWLYFSIFPDTFLWLNIFLKFFFVSLSKVKYATTLCDCHVCHTYLWFNIKLFLWLICAQFLLLNILLLICCSVAMSGTGMGE